MVQVINQSVCGGIAGRRPTQHQKALSFITMQEVFMRLLRNMLML